MKTSVLVASAVAATVAAASTATAEPAPDAEEEVTAASLTNDGHS